jgi:enamine deaminase RidA (YjgF/YER057c/UK114 family)
MKKAIEELGGKLEDVVRTRIFVTNIEDFEQVGKAHGQYFSDIKPACTLVEVSALVDPEMLVEMEMTAIISE